MMPQPIQEKSALRLIQYEAQTICLRRYGCPMNAYRLLNQVDELTQQYIQHEVYIIHVLYACYLLRLSIWAYV